MITKALKSHNDIFKKNILSWFIIFLLFYSYLTTAGFIFQKFILEFLAQNNTHLLLSPESTIANEIAISLNEKLKLDFWKNFSLVPQEGYGINVTILAFFYYILGVNPYTNIIINSLFYSLSALLLLLTFLKISNNSIYAKKSAFICSIIFLLWPSSLFWLSQITKDFMSTFSHLLLIFSFICLYRVDNLKSGLYYLLLSFLSLIIMFSVRDHFLQIQFIMLFVIIFILLNRFLSLRLSLKPKQIYLTFFIIIFTTYTSLIISDKNTSNIESNLVLNNLKIHQLKDISYEYFPDKETIWKKSNFIPNFIDKRLQAIIALNLINNINNIKFGASTPFNTNLEIKSSYDFIKSLPVILYQGLFEPYPLRFDIKQPKFLVVAIEMLFIYICFFLIPFIKSKSFDKIYIVIISFSIFYIIPITYTVSTYGSLYRLRGPFLLIIALIILRIFLEESSKKNK